MVLSRVTVNGRSYGPAADPVVVVLVDGSEPAYHEKAIAAGRMPYLEGVLRGGTSLDARCTMPAFTNPNNMSVATGVPPAVHGICGNYFYDRAADREVMMNDPGLLRAPTIFAAYAEAGARVAVITAKDKLRRLLGAGLVGPGTPGGICFSAEHADEDVLRRVGMPPPSVYSAELSELVMAAGVDILRTERPDLMFLSLTDYIQHKHAPGSPVADDFYAMLDRYYAELDALGCVLAITADHGMNAKTGPDGAPVVVYLQDHLDERLGHGAARVILPITDPYTVHHGSLGSFATVYLPPDADPAAITAELGALPGVEQVLTADAACATYELPADRMGDLVVIGDRTTALGTRTADHDLSGLDAPLRSHGGLAERGVPLIVNRPLTGPAPEPARPVPPGASRHRTRPVRRQRGAGDAAPPPGSCRTTRCTAGIWRTSRAARCGGRRR